MNTVWYIDALNVNCVETFLPLNMLSITNHSFSLSIRKSMTEYDPRLVAPACLYLASKAEESTVQARLLVFYIKKLCNHLLLSCSLLL